jgi:hypothetical protein
MNRNTAPRRPLLALLLTLLLAASLLGSQAGGAAAGFLHPEAPRLLNYYLRTDIPGKEVFLASFDLVVLPYQLIDWEPLSLALMRQANPDLRILAYIDPMLITDSLGPDDLPGTLRYDFVTGVDPAWLAYDENGDVISFWEHAEHVNVTPVCPEVGGERFRDYFVDFVNARFVPLIEAGVIHGIFLDEMSSGGYLWWDPLFAGTFDYNNNGLADRYEAGIGDAGVQAWLAESMRMIADSLRAALPPGAVVMGNNSKPRFDALHGKLYEAFPGSPGEGYFDGTLMDLDIWNSLEMGDNVTAVNGLYPYEELEGSPTDMPPFRFRFTGSLLSDNYFSYDFETFDHYQVVWYDLFDHELGLPLGQRFTVNESPLFVDTFEGSVGPYVAPFAPHTAVSITSEPGLVLQGSSSLLAVTNSTDPFPTLFYVQPPGGFQPDTTYVLSFRYRALEVALGETQLFFKKSPADTGEGAPPTSTTMLRPEAGAEGLYRAKIRLGSQASYSVRLVTKGLVSIVIDSLSVVYGDGGLLAREYENGLVVCNASEVGQTLAHDPEWLLLPGDEQAQDFAPWLNGNAIVLPNEDGVIFARNGTASELPPPSPARLGLSEPWPNPGNPSFSVRVWAEAGRALALSLHDVQGRRLAELWSGRPGPAGRVLAFSPGAGGLPALASGIYLLRISDGEQADQRRWVLLR